MVEPLDEDHSGGLGLIWVWVLGLGCGGVMFRRPVLE